ncbi:MAG: DivIVA domain-containing protein [Mycobacteriales bacterium]
MDARRHPQLQGLSAAGEPVTAEEIAGARFRSTLLGYPIREVDDLLDELQAAVEVTRWRAPAPPDEAAAEARTTSLAEAERASHDRTATHR